MEMMIMKQQKEKDDFVSISQIAEPTNKTQQQIADMIAETLTMEECWERENAAYLAGGTWS